MRTILLLLLCHAGFSQPPVKKLDKKSIPVNIQYAGNIVDAVSWKDQSGEHFVITTEKEGADNASLYAYHYVNNTQLWRVTDGITDCPVDLEAKFIKNAFAVTDLDRNGRAEIKSFRSFRSFKSFKSFRSFRSFRSFAYIDLNDLNDLNDFNDFN